jgi:hypothetical protein
MHLKILLPVVGKNYFESCIGKIPALKGNGHIV